MRATRSARKRNAGITAMRLERLHRQASADLLSYLARRSSSPEDAADMLAEVFLVAWRRIKQIPAEDSAARMWMFVVARNVHANWRRGIRRRSALADELRSAIATGSFAGAYPVGTADGDVRDAVAALPPNQRELVMLVHWEGFTVVEAAQILRLRESTARGRYQRAKTQLRARLQEPRDPSSVPAASPPSGGMPITYESRS